VLNEDQSRDILREEIGGDSPHCSGVWAGWRLWRALLCHDAAGAHCHPCCFVSCC
jgi:hypothetical protein